MIWGAFQCRIEQKAVSNPAQKRHINGTMPSENEILNRARRFDDGALTEIYNRENYFKILKMFYKEEA